MVWADQSRCIILINGADSLEGQGEVDQGNAVWDARSIHTLKGKEWRAQRSSVLKGAVLTKTVRSFMTREGLKTLY